MLSMVSESAEILTAWWICHTPKIYSLPVEMEGKNRGNATAAVEDRTYHYYHWEDHLDNGMALLFWHSCGIWATITASGLI